MIGEMRPKITRRLVAALYALTIVFVAFGFAGHTHRGVEIASAKSLGAEACAHAVSHTGKPANSPVACCDACALSAAPVTPNQIAHAFHSIEIATRLEFDLSLGRRLDHRPHDVRSRAPPKRRDFAGRRVSASAARLSQPTNFAPRRIGAPPPLALASPLGGGRPLS